MDLEVKILRGGYTMMYRGLHVILVHVIYLGFRVV
jgi:hypothetical protein